MTSISYLCVVGMFESVFLSNWLPYVNTSSFNIDICTISNLIQNYLSISYIFKKIE